MPARRPASQLDSWPDGWLAGQLATALGVLKISERFPELAPGEALPHEHPVERLFGKRHVEGVDRAGRTLMEFVGSGSKTPRCATVYGKLRIACMRDLRRFLRRGN